MKQSTLKKYQNEPETCNPPFIDLDVDLSYLGKNFTVKSSPSLKNEVWIPSEENVIDGSTLQENCEPKLQAFEQYYSDKSASFHTYCLEQLSSSDDLPEGWSGDCLICPGNAAFNCYNANNSLSCPKEKKIETLTWRVCPFYGILEILASNVVVWTTKVATVDGPICSFCERYVSRIYRTTTNSCVSCEHNYITTLFPPTPRILDIPKKDVPRKNKTLVFLCARLSAGNTLTVGYFDKLVASLEQSESNPGRFGKFNRPGLPAGMEIVGKFVARATATTKIETRYARTIKALPDWLPMNLLPEFILYRYWPGNSVIIGMTTPACLTVSPNHLNNGFKTLH